MTSRSIGTWGLAFFSLLFCFLFAEVICRVFFPDEQLRWTDDPDVLARYAPGQHARLTIADGKTSFPIAINELGFRDLPLSQLPRRKILTLGDSFAFGWGVSEDEVFSSLLGRSLGPEIGVLNGGHPGFGVWQLEATLRRVAPLVKPELTMVILWEGMFARRPPSDEAKAAFFRKSSWLHKAKTASLFGTYVYRRLETVLSRLGLVSLIVTMETDGAAGVQTGTNDSAFLRGFEADKQRLLAVSEEASSNGGKILLVLWPRAGFSSEETLSASRELETVLAAFAVENGLPFVSLRQAFAGVARERLLIPKDFHPTALAHCLVSAYLLESLRVLGYGVKAKPFCGVKGIV